MAPLTALYLAIAVAGGAVTLRRARANPDELMAMAMATAAVALGAAMVCGLPTRHGFTVIRLAAWAVFGVIPAWGAVAAIAVPGAPRARAVLLGAAALIWAIALDAFVREPRMLELTRYELRSAKVDAPLRIAVLTDLQTDHVGAHERAAIAMAMAEHPDVLLFPGDYVQGETVEAYRTLQRQLRDLLAETGASGARGAWAVQGNVDVPGFWPEIFDGLPIVAVRETTTFRQPGLAVTALSFHDGFDTDVVIAAEPAFHVAVAHAPDFALGRVDADLLIAGHTHGGQVRLPGIGALITYSKVPRSWAAGRTELSGGRTLIVSRGIGMERDEAPRLRFLCPPEVVIVDVLPAGP